MGMCVCGGAAIACSFGAAPSALTVLPDNKAVSSMPLATIMDNKPMVNILPFGMCMSMSNPQVAAATAAAMGALTPMPCMPLNQTSKLMCSWGGVIQITNPGTMNIQVP